MVQTSCDLELLKSVILLRESAKSVRTLQLSLLIRLVSPEPSGSPWTIPVFTQTTLRHY